MRGSLVQRYKGSWSVVLDLGYDVDPATGTKKRRQKWITVRGTRRDAEAELAKHVNDVHHGDFIRPNKMTFGHWLDEWVEKAIKPPAKAPSTYEHYRGVIARHLKPKLVMIPLQQLRSTDLKRAYLDAAQGDAMRVNGKGVFFCLQRVAREMIPRRRGVIVNIASIAGKGFAGASNVIYAGTKGAVISMSCIRPRAPRRETARGLLSDSASMTAATRSAGTLYRAATCLIYASISSSVSVSASVFPEATSTGAVSTRASWATGRASPVPARPDRKYPALTVTSRTPKPSRWRSMTQSGPWAFAERPTVSMPLWRGKYDTEIGSDDRSMG